MGKHAVDMGNMKTLYRITKTICNEGTLKNTAINDKGGKTITGDSSRLARKNTLKRSSTDHHR